MKDSPQSKGGKARAASLSPDERSQVARAGALARWSESERLPKVTYGSPDRPLKIGGVEIPCYVLEDGTRVLSQRGLYSGIGLSLSGRDRLVGLIGGKNISPFASEDLMPQLTSPIRFGNPAGGGVAYGYPATILPDICDAVLSARAQGALASKQLHIATQCELLVRGFARVGIIALVDEATGYQAERDRDELHRILEAYLSEERLAWAKRFPDEFYKQIYRLRNWKWPPVGRAKPPYLGHITNDIVYDRLPPGVLTELRRRNPTKDDTKRRHWKHHQFLYEDFGQPDLRDHLLQVIAAMRMSRSWDAFKRAFDEAFPKPGSQIEMKLERD